VSTIEDIILENDRRGVSQLRGYLPDNYCEQAARLILDHPGRALICSGFYIVGADAPETDGPPGAYYLGVALEALGHSVVQVTDHYSSYLYEGLVGGEGLVEFPIADTDASERFARELLDRLQPSVVISTERCGLTSAGQYLNMRGVDITQYNAKLDYLFLNHEVTVGIGDGGNEIGMGNLAQQIPTVETLPSDPAATQVTKLVLASVSNWGAYGLIAALSQLARRNLLPSASAEADLIRRMVDMGAVDGYQVARTYAVDGFSLEENGRLLERLSDVLTADGITTQ
jgi:hypothetical protein